MRRITKYLVLGLFIVQTLPLNANYDSYNSEIGSCYHDNAKKILDALKEKYTSYNDLTIHFTLEVELAERPKTSEKGSIIQQGELFKVMLKDQDIYCNGEDLWYYLKDKNEVQINDYEGGEDLGIVSPADLLRQYESGEYEYALHNSYSKDGRSFSEIEFKPNDSFSDYSKLRVSIDTNSWMIKDVLAFGKDGSRFRMILQKELYNQNYPIETFSFDLSNHPNVLVEDLRLD